jgi:hypothetical protein
MDVIRAWGFQNASTGPTIQTGRIETDVVREPGLPDDPLEILAPLPQELRETVDLTVSDDARGYGLYGDE